MTRGVVFIFSTLFIQVLLGFISKTDSTILSFNQTNNDNVASFVRKRPDEIGHNEDADLDARALIRKYGYRGESHKVTTEDGYILEMHRITGPKNNSNPEGKKVVFLMHGILSSSIDWIIAGPNKALAYLIADEGYDVWLGNARGNHFSRQHTQLSVLDKKYWSFSWHEIGTRDLPAMIDYVIDNTRQKKIFYAGHSQGTTTFFVMASEKPEYNDKIIAMFALAPVAYVHHMTSPFFQILARLESLITAPMNLIGQHEFAPTSEFLKRLSSIVCDEEAWSQPVCENIMFLIAGFGSDQTNRTLLPAVLGHVPAGASTRQVIHYAQLIKSKKFRQYDHGFMGNMLSYGKRKPAAYNLKQITAPVVLHYSVNDWLSDVKDVNRLEKELGNCYAKIRNPNSKFSHLDYLYGKDAHRILYSKVIGLMNTFSK
ncbi:lipase 3-like [Aphidius gifuensis]|nr:lipase 3-like [Aphidius gifuensis]